MNRKVLSVILGILIIILTVILGIRIFVFVNSIKVDLSTIDSQYVIKNKGTYFIKGSSENKTIVVDSSDNDVEIMLDNVNITNENEFINIKSGSNVTIKTNTNKNNITINNIESKGAIVSNDNLVIKGNGTINIKSNSKGISVKKDLDINVNINIDSKEDGIKANNINIENGKYDIKTLNDCIQAENDIFIKTGFFKLNTSETDELEVKSNKGIKSENNITIENGTFDINTIDDAIHSNGNIIINKGNYQINTKDDAIHADKYIEINNGKIDVQTSFEGIESYRIKINNGTIGINSSDDGINAKIVDLDENTIITEDTKSKIEITGGLITVKSYDDCIDVNNGDIYITGGILRLEAFENPKETNSPFGLLGDVNITGGTVFGVANVGIMSMPSSSSSVNAIGYYFAKTLEKDIITIKNSKNEEIYKYTPSDKYRYLVYFGSNLVTGETYDIYIAEEKFDDITLEDKYVVKAKDNSFMKVYEKYNWYIHNIEEINAIHNTINY